MRALQLTAWQHEPDLVEVDVPEPAPGEVLITWGAPEPAIQICT